MRNLFVRLSIASLLLLLPLGCMKRPTLPSWVSKMPAIKPPIGHEEIIRLPEGDRISSGELLDDLHKAKVIFMGESHDQPEHHRNQLMVLRALLERGKEVVVAMEMFERSQQPILDRWSQGSLAEEEFLKEIHWEATWGMEYELYKGILDEAKNRRLKVLALNVPKDLVRKVAQKGIKGLSPEDKKNLPEMELTDKEHRSYIRSIFKGHQGGSAEGFEHFYQAQCLWDEGMAEALSDFLKSSDGEGKTVVVITGSGHVVFDFGIPKRFHRRTPLPYRTIVLKEWKSDLNQDLAFAKTNLPLANYLWITQPTPSDKKRPRIGVVLKEREEPRGVWIERVIPQSPAEKAGLLPGDQILSVNGKEIIQLKDLHHAVAGKDPGREIAMTILREGSKREITVTFTK
ncbi:MAG: ChaN family lipoprotein [Syntrophaceae bacterium]|nr:ChaN family lipoprotein [Syntrophaceae bacterium]